MRKEGALSLRGYNSLLFDFAEYYLRLFRAVVAVVVSCWLVVRGICTGGLSEDGCDVRPKAAKRAWRRHVQETPFPSLLIHMY